MCRKYWPPTRPRYDKLRILYSDAAGLLYHHYYYDYHYYYYYYYYYYCKAIQTRQDKTLIL